MVIDNLRDKPNTSQPRPVPSALAVTATRALIRRVSRQPHLHYRLERIAPKQRSPPTPPTPPRAYDEMKPAGIESVWHLVCSTYPHEKLQSTMHLVVDCNVCRQGVAALCGLVFVSAVALLRLLRLQGLARVPGQIGLTMPAA